MKNSFALIASTLLLSITFAGVAQAANSLSVVAQCHISSHADTGVNVEIVDAGPIAYSGLLLAIITSAGNVRPHIIGAFPVQVVPNGAGIITYSGRDFLLTRSTQTNLISLKSGGSEPVEISGSGIGFSCL